MLVPHLHFKGECLQAMALYSKAFDAKINEICLIDEGKPEKGVLHAEMTIYGQRVMLNDNLSEGCDIDFPFAQLIMIFDNEQSLKKAFEILKDDKRIVCPMSATDYTSCAVGFWDKFGVRWSFMIE